jgi:1,4-dihydroxy-2-naphthoate octaprenyltransferase
VLVAAPYVLGLAWAAAGRPWAGFLPLATLPIAVRLVRGVWGEPPSPRFNRFLALTALLQLVFCALAAGGLVVR